MQEQDLRKPEVITALEKCGHVLHHRCGHKNGQNRILRMLYVARERDGRESLTQLELQNMLGIRSGSISEILGKMESAGMIKRMRMEEDRRKICLAITDHGKELFLQERRRRHDQDMELLSFLSQEEQKELLELLNKLLEGWKQEMDG